MLRLRLSLSTSWTLYFDGSCEPTNPGGTAAYGWVLYTPDGIVASSGSGVHCRGQGATNNVAEWAGVEAGVKHFTSAGLNGGLLIKGDSRLVIYQLTGRYRCHKPHLAAFRDRVLDLLEGVNWSALWIPREKNTEADALSGSSHAPCKKRWKKWRVRR